MMILSPLMTKQSYSYGYDNTIEKFSFKTLNGYYLSAVNGGNSTITADVDKTGSWEKFEIIDQGKGYVAIKSHDGYYLSACNDEINLLVNGTEVGKRQKFKIIELDNDKVALKTYYDKYVCAENGGGGKVIADKTNVGSWESFELIKYQEINPDDKCALTAVTDDKNVTFTWTKPSNTNNIIGYNLYRGTDSGRQSDTPITDFPIEHTSYVDNNLNSETTYYYVLKAVYKDKTLGAASNEVSVILKSNIILNARAVDDGINLTWNKTNYSYNIVGYYIYRATKSGRQSSTPITDFPITATSYTDKNIENNKTYYYIVKAVYLDKTIGESSNEVSSETNFGKTIVLQVGSKYMYVNGKKTEIDAGKRTEVIIKNGRTFVPIRAIIENMGGKVEWNENDERVSINLNDNTIYLWIGNKTSSVNGKNKETDVAPYISDTYRAMLPLRFIVENLDCEVDWDGLTKTITIKTKY